MIASCMLFPVFFKIIIRIFMKISVFKLYFLQIRVNEKLSEIMQKLWELDHNKLERNVDYIIDLQGHLIFKLNQLNDFN